MSIRKNRILTRRGTNLLEVILATFILAVAIIPIYRSFSSGAVQEIETTKISMARKILESLKNEMSNHPFDEVKSFFTGAGTAFEQIPEVGIPLTLRELLNHQKKYKDFVLKVFLRYTNSAKSVIECKGTVEWHNESSKLKSEELQFLMVKP